MIKPILDALIGVVYADDRQAAHIEARSVNLVTASDSSHVGALVATELTRRAEFLHVWIEEER